MRSPESPEREGEGEGDGLEANGTLDDRAYHAAWYPRSGHHV